MTSYNHLNKLFEKATKPTTIFIPYSFINAQTIELSTSLIPESPKKRAV